MMHLYRSSILSNARRLILLAALACSGCASKEKLPSFYALTPPASNASSSVSLSGQRIFIRHVTIPGYLQPIKIASRRGDGQIEYSSTALWAGTLRESFGRAVADALEQQPGIRAVSAPPMPIPPPRDYDLVIDLERFEGNDAGEVVLFARWQLYQPESAAPLVSRQSRLVQSGWTYGDEANQARLLGVNVEELAAQIARATRR